MAGLVPAIHVSIEAQKTWMPATSAGMTERVINLTGTRLDADHAATADLPMAALTRGMTSSAINCIERLLSAGSTQSMPA